VNVNVAIAFGATLISLVVLTRFAVNQPMARPASAWAVESPLTPRFTWRPATPLCQVSVPVFRKWIVYETVPPGRSVGHGD